MKTILLTIPRGVVARNLLENDFYRQLRQRYHIVILTPAATDPDFLDRFNHPHATFLEFKEISHTRVDAWFVGLQKYLTYNRFTGLKKRYGIRGVSQPSDASRTRYHLYAMIFWPLSRLVFLRDLVRWFDYRWGQRKVVTACRKIITQYQPALIISTSLLSNIETALVKAGRQSGVPVIGMPKSWDNLSKAAARVKPDILVVWSQFMAEQAVKWQNMPPERIKIIGIPQFDLYADKRRLWPRDRFLKEFGLDPNKKTILYASGGKGIPEDRELVQIVYEEMRQITNRPVQLLIRPHYKYIRDADKFTKLSTWPDVRIDQRDSNSVSFRDQGDYSVTGSERLMNMIYHSNVIINTASTINLDAAAFDKPIINLALREVIGDAPVGASYLMFYESDYVKELMAVGASFLVGSREELRVALDRQLSRPDGQRAERSKLIQEFCYRVDGQAGRRLADLAEQMTKSSL